jgi:uncharacterized repeat protein (TIGR03803 family)
MTIRGQPQAGLKLGSDGNFYGTSAFGGIRADNYGLCGGFEETVFRVTTNGTLTTLVSCIRLNGANPHGALTLGRDGNLYGTTPSGGSGNFGTVFRMTTSGTMATLVSFAYPNGANPAAALTLGSDGDFYGTTFGGGRSGDGTVFRITTNGALTTLASFNILNGAQPQEALTAANDGNFYGTTYAGGLSALINGFGFGTVFRVTTNGVLTRLVSFDLYTNSAYPNGLTLGSDGSLYGTTGGYPSLFRVTTHGIFTTLASLDTLNFGGPSAALTLGNDGNFYRTTFGGGGGSGIGVIYRLRRGAYVQSFGMATNGFALLLNFGGSGMVVLESSPDLKVWTPIQTNAQPQHNNSWIPQPPLSHVNFTVSRS